MRDLLGNHPQKNTENEQYLKLLQTIIDIISDEIKVIRPDRTIKFLNQSGCDDFQILSGMKDIKCYSLYGKDKPCEDCNLEKVIAKKEPMVFDKRESHRMLCISYYPILNRKKEVEFIVQISKDITKQVEYEERLINAKNKAEKENKLKTKFLANIIHEVRTPINGIIGITELLSNTIINEKQQEYIRILQFSANRLLNLINDILDLSKIEEGMFYLEKKEFYFPDFINNILSFFDVQIKEKGLNFFYNIDFKIPSYLVADENRLNQILFNILGNALKFTEQGQITFEAQLIKKRKKEAAIRFSVSDTGIGISQDMQENIFKDFVQLSSTGKYRGTGLGLAITKKLVELMDGSIKVESKEGVGSTFIFEIKVGISEIRQNQTNKPIRKDNGDSNPIKLNILVAEDDKINRTIIKELLEKKGWKVTLAFNGEEVFDILNRNFFDLILLDLQMPGMDGYETAAEIRKMQDKTKKNTPIIALTASVMKSDRERCLEIGIDDYLSKPIRANELYKAIFKIIQEKNKNIKEHFKILLDRLEGNEEVFLEIIEEFISPAYSKDYFHKIEQYIEYRDFINLSKIAHKLKGSISYFEIQTLSQLVEQLEYKAKSKDLDGVKVLLGKIKFEYGQIKNTIKKELEMYNNKYQK